MQQVKNAIKPNVGKAKNGEDNVPRMCYKKAINDLIAFFFVKFQFGMTKNVSLSKILPNLDIFFHMTKNGLSKNAKNGGLTQIVCNKSLILTR